MAKSTARANVSMASVMSPMPDLVQSGNEDGKTFATVWEQLDRRDFSRGFCGFAKKDGTAS